MVGTLSNSILHVDAGLGEWAAMLDGYSEEAVCAAGDASDSSASTVYTAAGSGLIRAWDVESHHVQWRTLLNELDGKPTSLAIGPVDNSVAIGTQAGFVILLEPSGKRAMQRVVVNEPVSAVLYSRSGTQLAVGTSTGTVAIYDVTDAYGLVGTIDVSNMAVLHLDWSVDGTLVQATTSSLTTYVAVDELSVAAASHVAKASWTYHASPIGWATQGTLKALAEGADRVTAVACQSDTSILAAGDNLGRLSLYHFPATSTNATSLDYCNHADGITSLAFVGNWLLSSGGADGSVMQYSVKSARDAGSPSASPVHLMVPEADHGLKPTLV